MAPKAGDTVFSLGSIVIDSDNTVRISADVAVLGKGDVLHRLTPQNFRITLTDDQKAQVAALRASLEASALAALPAPLQDAKKVAGQSRAERSAARREKHLARTGHTQ